MKYNSIKMIKKSRFKKFIKTLDSNTFNSTIKHMNKIIEENKIYEDKQNYEYLCNLFSSLGLVFTFIDQGYSKEESQEIVFNAMYDYLKPQVKKMQKLAKHKFMITLLKIVMPKKVKRTCGYGWKIEFIKTPKNIFSMTTHKCIFKDIFTKYNMPEMTKGFCKVDNLLYDNLPKTKFYYTQRLGENGNYCDYSFKKED